MNIDWLNQPIQFYKCSSPNCFGPHDNYTGVSTFLFFIVALYYCK